MIKTKRICDRCNREIKKTGMLNFRTKFGKMSFEEEVVGSNWYNEFYQCNTGSFKTTEYDMCKDCWNKFKDFMKMRG